MRIAVVLLLIPVIAGAAIIPAGEHAVTPVAFGEAAGTQAQPALAAAGSDVLGAWVDTTAGRSGVYTAVVSEPGSASVPIRIWSGAAATPLLCWTGTNYIAAWSDTHEANLMVALLDRSGAVVGAPHVVQTGLAPVPNPGALVWNGHVAMLLYRTYGAAFVMRLDVNANATGDSITIGSPGTPATIAAAGGKFAIVYLDLSTSRLRVTRAGDSGGLLDANPPAIATWTGFSAPVALSSASDGTSQVAVTFGSFDGTQTQAQSVGFDMNSLVTRPLPDVIVPGPTRATLSVLWMGGRFVVSGANSFQIVTEPLDGSPRVFTYGALTQSIADMAVAWNGIHLLYAWTQFLQSGTDVDLLEADSGGNPAGTPFALSTAATSQIRAAIAPGLVVWGEARSDGNSAELFAEPIDDAGAPTGPPLQLSSGGAVSLALRPQIVETPALWFVLWREDVAFATQIVARTIGRDGQPLQTAAFKIANASSASVASNGTTFAVAMSGGQIDFFDANANLTGTASIPNVQAPAIASNGDGFLVAWERPGSSPFTIVAARISASGSVIDTTPITIARGVPDQLAPAVASDGKDYLVAWRQGFADGAALEAQRVDANGTLDGGPATIAPQGFFTGWSIAGDANGYWMAYEDALMTRYEAAHLDANGNVTDRGIIALAPWSAAPAIVPGLAAFARIVSGYDVPRVFTERLWIAPRAHAAAR